MSAAAGPDLIQDGLVLCLDAANPRSYSGSGTIWRDLSGFNRDFNINTATFNTGRWINVGNATGATSQSTLNLGSIAITVSAWIKDNGNGNWNNYIRNNWVNNGWLLFSDTNNWYFSCAQAGSQNTASFAHNNSRQWTNLIGTYDGSAVRLYVNGFLKSSQSKSGLTLDTGFAISIANAASGQNYDIAHASIYNRALNSTEVLQNYNALKGRFGLT